MSLLRADDAEVAEGYVRVLRELLGALDLEAFGRVMQALRDARSRGSAVYIAGNGGAAAGASHFAADLSKATRSAARPLRISGLCDNTSLITALANDEGHERIFVGQLQASLGPGDVLIVMSASGNSASVLRAVDLARERGATSVAFVGFDGGSLKGRADIAIHVASEVGRYGPVEDAFLAIHHLVTECLSRDP